MQLYVAMLNELLQFRDICLSDSFTFSSNDVAQLISFYAPPNDITALFSFFPFSFFFSV